MEISNENKYFVFIPIFSSIKMNLVISIHVFGCRVRLKQIFVFISRLNYNINGNRESEY